jgi:hypothetical protein
MHPLLPNIGFNPAGKHCACYFDQMIDLRGEKPTFEGTITEQMEASEKFYQSLQDRMPSINELAEVLERTFPEEHLAHLHRFVEQDDRVVVNGHDTDHYGVRRTLDHHSIPFASSLNMQLESAFLDCDLHNGGTAPLGTLMYAHAFPVLKNIYEAYNFDASILPTIAFEKECATFTIPRIEIQEKLAFNRIVQPFIKYMREYTHFSADGFHEICSLDGELRVAPQSLEGTIPIKKDNLLQRNITFISLLSASIEQVRFAHILRERKNES